MKTAIAVALALVMNLALAQEQDTGSKATEPADSDVPAQGDDGGSRAQDHNSSRSNKTARAANHNSTRSNRRMAAPNQNASRNNKSGGAPVDAQGNGSNAQDSEGADYNSSRSNRVVHASSHASESAGSDAVDALACDAAAGTDCPEDAPTKAFNQNSSRSNRSKAPDTPRD